MTPEWTVVNLAIQAIAGILGAHTAAMAAQEHHFGFVGHSLVGLIAGTLSGYFLQRIVMTTVYGTGDTAFRLRDRHLSGGRRLGRGWHRDARHRVAALRDVENLKQVIWEGKSP